MSLRVSNNNGYTIGYNSGINYADGRVNTSSSSYTNGYSSGRNSVTDVSKLTTGERWLMAIVGIEMGRVDENYYNEITRFYMCGSDLSFSSVSTVNIQCTESESNYAWANNFIVAIGGSQVNFYNTSYGQVLTAYPSIGPVYVMCSPDSNYAIYHKFAIISFTTKDGKVHTKDNLNY